jgi:hypothetical protein
VKIFKPRNFGFAALAALVIGNVAALLGVDIAPEQIDVLVTAGATLVAIYAQWRAGKAA